MPGLLPSVAPSLPRFANRVPGAPEFRLSRRTFRVRDDPANTRYSKAKYDF